MRFMLNWLFTSIAIAIATLLVPGIQPFGFAEAWVCFAFVGLFLNIVDSLVKPFLTVISLPLTIITLGIFQLVVNSFMLSWPATCRSICWARASPSPALDRPLWAASWYPSCAASSTASLRAKTAIPAAPVSTAQNKGRPSQKMGGLLICQVSKGEENLPFPPCPHMAAVG